MRLVPQGTMPADLKFGVRMQRESASEAARGRRTFGPPCIAAWSSWSVQSAPDPIVPGSPFTYYVWPASDTVLCDDDCLEWAAEWTGCTSGAPSYTITAGDDCVGVIVEVDDTEAALEGCTLTLTATLSGAPFGDPVVLSFAPACEKVCNGYIGGGTFPEFLDSVTPVEIAFELSAETPANFCGFEDSITFESSPSTIGLYGTVAGPWYAATVSIYCDFGQEATSFAGQSISIQPYIDTGSGPVAFCDPLVINCEV